MRMVERVCRALVRALRRAVTRVLGPLGRGAAGRAGRGPDDGKVISILPYLDRRAAGLSGHGRLGQLIDLRSAPQFRRWRWPSRRPLGRS